MTLVLRGPRVTLRPLRADELALLQEGRDFAAFGGGAPDPASDRLLRERISRSGHLVDGWLDLGIEADGRLVGDVGARRPPGSLPPGVFELGISIFAKSDRGRGIGAEAIRLVTAHLFDELDAFRVQAATAVSNEPMRALLRRLGFVEEGILRAFMPRADGSRDDYVMSAITRDAWERAG